MELLLALHIANSCGHFELFQLLIQLKANINTRDKNGETVLHCASSDRNIEFVKFFISNRANRFDFFHGELQIFMSLVVNVRKFYFSFE